MKTAKVTLLDDNQVIEFFKSLFENHKTYNLILASGNTIENLVKKAFPFHNQCASFFNIFLSDERCVNPNSIHSNSFRFKEIFKNYCSNLKLHLPSSSHEDWLKISREYGSNYPKEIHLTLLSLADDGHFASIWPGYNLQEDYSFNLIPKELSLGKYTRMSVSLKKINSSKKVILLVFGNKKNLLLKKIFKDKNHPLHRIKKLEIISDSITELK